MDKEYVCSVCKDTHMMWHTELERNVMCTSCPTPCKGCQNNGTGPYCTTTPCYCECHKDPVTLRVPELQDTQSTNVLRLVEKFEHWKGSLYASTGIPKELLVPVGTEYIQITCGNCGGGPLVLHRLKVDGKYVSGRIYQICHNCKVIGRMNYVTDDGPAGGAVEPKEPEDTSPGVKGKSKSKRKTIREWAVSDRCPRCHRTIKNLLRARSCIRCGWESKGYKAERRMQEITEVAQQRILEFYGKESADTAIFDWLDEEELKEYDRLHIVFRATENMTREEATERIKRSRKERADNG